MKNAYNSGLNRYRVECLLIDRFYLSRGFTLIEAIVALMIVGMFVSVLLPSILSTLDRQEDQVLRARALILATAKMAEYQLIAETEEGVFHGADSGLNWTSEIRRASPDRTGQRQVFLVLRHIQVQVLLDDELLVSLEVQKVGRP